MQRLQSAAYAALLVIGATTAQAQPVAPAAPPDARQARRTPVVDVFEATRDSVVNIASTQVIEVRSPFGFDSLFDFGFDLPDRPGFRGRGRQIRQTSVGSGFVLHEAGYIVTNAHVVARTAERKVVFADGSAFDAEIVAIDEPRDLAVLKIDPTNPTPHAGPEATAPAATEGPGAPATPRPLHPLPLGSSADLMVGETVIAIGNPLGFQHTVTAGVVSAVNRELPVDENNSLTGLIQTDASINPGNSGGPLLNVLGELVGINTAIRADAQNIGFAIPVDQLRELLPVMLDVERRYRVRIGLTVSTGTPAEVLAVEPGSPAADVFQPGDAITRINGSDVHSGIDYHIALIGIAPGDVPVRIRRAGVERDATLHVAQRPRPDGERLLFAKLGIEARPLDPREAARLGLPRLRGLIVTGIQLNGPAEAAGIEPDDVLIQIGRHQPQTLDEVGELLEPVSPGDRVDIGVIRIQGRRVYRALTTLQAR